MREGVRLMRRRTKHPVNLTMTQVWRYSKRDWFGYYLTWPLCAIGIHTDHCLGSCDPQRGRWVRGT